jgi:hypothetical protein
MPDALWVIQFQGLSAPSNANCVGVLDENIAAMVYSLPASRLSLFFILKSTPSLIVRDVNSMPPEVET